MTAHLDQQDGDGCHHSRAPGDYPEPIAIIGMSCRLPGGASSPEKLWEKLERSESAWSTPPKERFNMEAFHDATNSYATTTNTPGGHFLNDDVKTFDAPLFGIHPAEANAIDPQQRLMLEVAYEAFENAGLSLASTKRSNTGVYIGQWSSDYSEILSRDPEYNALYHTTGAGPAITSNRISYFFDLKGPSFTVDTGCSASLVALHTAVQGLRLGETQMALVGGVNLLLDPQRFAYQSKLRMFSSQGRSFSFDHRADGYGRGEGCCAIVLKPLSAAIKANDSIRAVIRNSVINQDGKTPGISVPSGLAQEEAIRSAYSNAGLPLQVDYVEAHGTGTAVGDPIEVGAIAAAFGVGRDLEDPLPIGSIKGNIGHTESCAGIAGLVKAVLMLEKDLIPPQVNFEKPNPKLYLDEWNLRIPTRLERKHLSCISVNSFGYGGTNAHVILEKHPRAIGAVPLANGNGHVNGHHQHDIAVNGLQNGTKHSHCATNGHSVINGNSVVNGHSTKSSQSLSNGASPAKVKQSDSNRALLFAISGFNDQSCQRNAARIMEYVSQHKSSTSPEWLHRLAYTLSTRTMYQKAAFLTAKNADELCAKLRVMSQMASFPTGKPHAANRSSIAFVFTGQGAQYHDMGRALIDTNPVFSASLERAKQVLISLGASWDLHEELRKSPRDTRINNPEYGQPLTTCIQLALVDSLAAFGVTPSAVVGHSSGEVAAAYTAKILTFEDAMRVSYFRGKLTEELIKSSSAYKGAMLAVGASAADVEKYLQRLGADGPKVCIACFNSPGSVTISGDNKVIDVLANLLEADSVFNRKLRTNGAAYHSSWMEQIAQDYLRSLQNIEPVPVAAVQMVSTVTGNFVEAKRLLDASYWVTNLVSPVRFVDALTQLMRDGVERLAAGVHTILEIGPHSQLKGPIEQTIQGLRAGLKDSVHYVATLARNADAEASMLECLSQLRLDGYEVDLQLANNRLSTKMPERLMDVPSYAFDHSTQYWHESRISKAFRNRSFSPHELIGNLEPGCINIEPRWRSFVRLESIPWLRDHVVQGSVVFPAAGYLAMAMEAVKRHKLMQPQTQSNPVITSFEFQRVSISKALLLSENKPDLEMSISLRPETRTAKASSESWMEFKIFSVHQQQSWTEHSRGLIRANTAVSAMQGAARSQQQHLVIPGSAQFLKDGSTQETRRQVSVNKFYHLCREIGLDWRGPFASVEDLKIGPQAGITITKIPLVGGQISPSREQTTYTVHPTTLDACLFHGLCAILVLEDNISSTVVPTFINYLAISANISKTPGTLLQGFSRKAPGHLTFDVMMQEGDNEDPSQSLVLYAEGVTASQLAPESPVSGATTRQLCHGVSQVTYCDSMSRQHLTDLCHSEFSEGSVLEQNRQLEALVQRYIAIAVDKTLSGEVTLPHRISWLRWMQASLEQVGTPGPQAEPVDLGILGETIDRMGPHLDKLLTGEMDPLLLFSEGNLLSRLYTEERCPRCYIQIARYLAELGQQRPGLKVIEIGGGTASASLPILQSCQRPSGNLISEYHFTDLSTGFFSAAKDRLADFEGVKYGVLDIEQDPESQGFQLGAYDIVVACNVVHATRSISDSVSHAKALLRPGGSLVLMEITKNQLYYNLVFGAFAGWWAGSEEGRTLSPLLSPAVWTEELSRHGFVDTDEQFADYPDKDGGSLSVFLAKVPETNNGVASLPVNIIHHEHDNLPWARQLGAILEPHQSSVTTGGLDDPHAEQGVSIFFPELVHSLSSSLTSHEWEKFRQHILQSKACLFLSVGATHDVQDPCGGLIHGFLRCLRLEHPDIRLVSLDLDPDTVERATDGRVSPITTVLSSAAFGTSVTSSTVDVEFMERNGQLSVPRVMHDEALDEVIRRASGQAETHMTSFLKSGRSMQAKLATPGLLETLSWTDMPCDEWLIDENQVKIELRAASINFKDVLIAAGQLDGITEMRNDCSGVVLEVGSAASSRFKKGDRVCAYYSQSYNNYPVVSAACCAIIPDSMSWEEAASIPIVWGTVYYSLIDKAGLQMGETVLIHSGAGAVGQAAIALSQHLGAEVYATAGSDAKRRFLMKEYNIPEDHLFSSRDTCFAREIMARTGGKGVDVVLNSLSGELFRESCNVVKKFGRFVEIGRKDFLDNSLMPSKFLLNNVTFALVDLAQIIEENQPLARSILERVLSFLQNNVVKPVTITTMEISDIEAAFRMIQAGKHVGKIVLTVQNEQMVKALQPAPVLAHLRNDGLYIVVGGFGGLGRGIVEWLAQRGASKIVIISRSDIDEDKTSFMRNVQGRTGAVILPRKCNVESADDLGALLDNLSTEGTVRGLIHSAMVLQDSILDDMSYEQWKLTLEPKVAGTWNLHSLLRNSNLDFFISLSSAVAISGNFGQSNYAGACSFQDAFARYQCRLGLPAFSINVGAVVNAGFVSENPEVAMLLRRQGLGTITISQLLVLINHLVVHAAEVDTSNCQRSIGLLPQGTELGLRPSSWLSEARFAHLALRATSSAPASTKSGDVVEALQSAKDQNDRINIICQAIMLQLSKLISVPLENMVAEQSMDAIGVDSLIAVELRNWIATRLRVNLSILVIRESQSFTHLAKIISSESQIAGANEVR